MLAGEEGVRELIVATEPDLVLNGIVGAAGLASTVVALTAGIDVALANKESLVLGGELVMALAEATGARLLPVDSEHSALHQLIGRRRRVRSTAWSSPPPAARSAAAPTSTRSASTRRSPTRPGRWAAGSRSTRRR